MSRLMLRILVVVALALGWVLAIAQRHNTYPRPPSPSEATTPNTPQAPLKKHFDAVQAQHDARELSDLAKSIPLDIDRVNQGLLPKDTVEKLKRIEKLSKHLRSEITF